MSRNIDRRCRGLNSVSDQAMQSVYHDAQLGVLNVLKQLRIHNGSEEVNIPVVRVSTNGTLSAAQSVFASAYLKTINI
jgi:hypothetical protein